MDRIPSPTRQDLLTIMSTEHFTLQGARSAAISDANGRTGFFLSTLSAGVVALAFVAQVAQAGPAFIILALIVLPTLLVGGCRRGTKRTYRTRSRAEPDRCRASADGHQPG